MKMSTFVSNEIGMWLDYMYLRNLLNMTIIGLFAVERIPANDLVVIYHGELSTEGAIKYATVRDFYSWTIDWKGAPRRLDAYEIRNVSRLLYTPLPSLLRLPSFLSLRKLPMWYVYHQTLTFTQTNKYLAPESLLQSKYGISHL
jgi:hypothetical protein